MSISKIRSSFEKKGCQAVLWVIGGLTCIGLLYTGTCSGMMPWSQPRNASESIGLVAELSGQKVGSDDVLKIADELRKARPTNGDPRAEFRLTIDALNQALTLIAIDTLAKSKGVVADEKTTTAYVDRDFTERAARLKASYVASKKIKEGATDAEFDAAFKKDPASGGKSLAEIKAGSVQQAMALLADPEQGRVFKGQVVADELAQIYAKSVDASPEAYKKANETFELKSLPLDDRKVPLAERQELAKKALADLKGGMKFPDAIKKYAKLKPDISLPYPRSLIQSSPDLAPILSLKPGQISDVIMYQGNPVIFVLDTVKSSLPPDFEKKSQVYLDSFRTAEGTRLFGKALEEVRKGVKWHSDVCRISFELGELETRGPVGGLDSFQAEIKEKQAKLKDAKPTDLLGAKLLPMAKFEAFEAVFLSAPPEQQKELRSERSDLIREVLADTESVALRLELYDNELQNNNFEAAGEALLDAAKNNTGTDPIAMDNNTKIVQKLKEAETAKKIDKAILDSVRTEIENFKKGVLDAEKEKQEAAKDQANVDAELRKLDESGKSGGQPKADPGKSKDGGK